MTEKAPRIFISYSWTSSDRVLELAKRLMSDGVEVVLDKWDLKEGQDKYAFMEKSVTDATIDKVLLICDKAYAEKANMRKGGVGDETTVISPEVYEKTTETKYIPIIFERDENGKEYLPAYLKARIYIDLSNEEQFEKSYESLLRTIHGKPENRKPAVGKMPEWLNDESVDFSGIRSLLKQVQHFDGKNKNKIEYLIRKFSEQFIIAVNSLAPVKNERFDEALLAQIDNAKPLRDLFFDYVEGLIACDLETGTIIGDFFEHLYNETFRIPIGRNSYSESEFEFSKFLIWEMFIGATAILLHNEKYIEIRELLYRTYFLNDNPHSPSPKPITYFEFRHTHRYIDDYIKPKSETPNKFTLAGDIVIKRERKPIITQQSLANADLVLYQLSCVYNYSGNLYHYHWFPMLYCYMSRYSKQPIWSKMVSLRYCQKLFPLFNVSSLEQLKKAVEKSKPNRDMRYNNSFDSAASIQDSIKLEEIGTLP